jgi:hypothetical protein
MLGWLQNRSGFFVCQKKSFGFEIISVRWKIKFRCSVWIKKAPYVETTSALP